ncbi:hypothetical protein SAMN04488057_104279 [Cyclobacterium lianum]|uniref:YceI-like domain-containing protein n=2 Tax=Cyclobacterium lianum TaxID=388280 RepID=A0A1M7MFW6_9BACT|nr:hypothetical protein SAMN04488057_104279 [Cyclobacterium lianum]
MGNDSFTRNILYTLAITSMIFFSVNMAKAQDLYHTTNGRVLLIVPVGDSVINLHSQKLFAELDYKEAYFKMTLPANSLYSGVDSLDAVISSMEDAKIILAGQLNITKSGEGEDKIDTGKHPPKTFEFRATLNYKTSDLPISGTGSLEHIEGGSHLKCVLGLTFEVSAEFLQNRLSESKNIKVHIHQLVLDQTL